MTIGNSEEYLNQRDTIRDPRNNPGFLGDMMMGRISDMASVPMGLYQGIQNQANILKASQTNTPQTSTPQELPKKSTIENEVSFGKYDPAWKDAALDKTRSVTKDLGAKTAAIGDNISKSINDAFTSDDPIKFSEGIGEFRKFDDMDLDPSTPAGQFKMQADQKYLKSVDDKGNKIYECPLTKKPCGKKTFWSRLKEFFLSIMGVQDKQTTQERINKLDMQDPISKTYATSQGQVSVPKMPENPWLEKQPSAYKASLDYDYRGEMQ